MTGASALVAATIQTLAGIKYILAVPLFAGKEPLGVMLFSSKFIFTFVNRHPTVKMLALAFLLLIGVILIADGFGMHVPKGYIYFALAFSVAVETLNHVVRRRRKRLRVEAKASP